MERPENRQLPTFEKLQAIIYAASVGKDELLYSEDFIALSEKTMDFDDELKLALTVQIKAVIRNLPPKLKENPPKSSFSTSAEMLHFCLNIFQKNIPKKPFLN